MIDPGRADEPDIDLELVKKKYREERDKRLREDGEHQYLEVVREFAHFYEVDPYATRRFARGAITEEIEVAIIGGGFAGLMAGAHLKKAGIDNIRIIEMAADFGGCWYWNRYPGAQCDVDSYCYLPLLEELNHIPSEKYAFNPEIYKHCQNVAERFDLYEVAHFETQVLALRWDASINRWRIATNRGDDIRARFIIMAVGITNRPKLPGIPGIETFRGHSFHTARWDYRYTGGDTFGGLVKLSDKRVAIIGTGATAIQCIPHLAQHASHLFVFQRTPAAVDVRGNKPTDPNWAKSLRPGWQRARRENFDEIVRGAPATEDLVCDGFTEMTRRISFGAGGKLAPDQVSKAIESADFRIMERIRRRVDEVVQDRGVAEALKPWYRFGCKRPCFSDDYLPTFNRPNVTLVDVSASKGVEKISKRGLVANGVEYAVDCIIYSSGFEVLGDFRRRFGIPVIEGRDGLSLYEHWKDGFRTHHGFTSHGFPNQFWTLFTQVGISANITAMLDDQTSHIAYIIKEALVRGAATVEPSQEAQDNWVATIKELAVSNREFWRECTPGYFNNEGGPVMRAVHGDVYTPGLNAFNALLKRWRENGNLDGLMLGN